MTLLLGVFYLLVICAAIASMALLVFRGRRTAYNRAYLLCQGMAVLWCAAQILALLSETEAEWKFSCFLGNLGICLIGSFWYYFAVLYTGKPCHPVRKYFPFVLSAFHFGMFLTNPWHHLYYTVFDRGVLEHGIFFYSNVTVTYLLVFGGAWILYRDFVGRPEGRRGRQLIIAAVITPVLFNSLYLAGISRTDFDITPLGFGISVILVWVATMKYQFMDVNITAFDQILSGLSDGIAVFGWDGMANYVNGMFCTLLGLDPAQKSVLDLGEIFAHIRSLDLPREDPAAAAPAAAPLLRSKGEQYLQIQIYQSLGAAKEFLWSGEGPAFREVSLEGCQEKCTTVIMVHNMSRYYAMLQQARELAVTNEQLALERERNRIAQQVHDTAGHTLTMLQSYMKLAMVASEKQDSAQVDEYLTQARNLAFDGVRELRQSINQMKKEQGLELVTQGMMQLSDRVKEIPVELTVQGEDSDRYSHLSGILYACVREMITNTLKYADASRIEIVLRFQEQGVELVYGDDGRGCERIEENNGIRGIRERTAQSGGSVRFVTSPGEGFLMRLRLPL